ncbi:hypothetical protein FRC06_008494 [Ceratobasidium sp. 370]|nr:hypothetical protein FRC06_008494 [Ceratobasidium sp. 370]
MRMCKAEVTVKGKNNWFTEQEAAWLLTHYNEYEELPTGKTKDENTARLNFYNALEKEFCEKFPYRDPAGNMSWTFTSKQQELAMSKDDRQKLCRRIGDKFRNHRKHAMVGVPGAKTSLKSVDASVKSGAEQSAPSPPNTPSDELGCVRKLLDLGRSSEQAADSYGLTGGDTDTRSSGALSDVRALGTRYGTSKQDCQEMEQVIIDMRAMTEMSWASIGDEELRECVNVTLVML